MSTLLEEALRYAARGIAVFPCGPDKQPRTPRGFHDATTDPDEIARLFANADETHTMLGAAIPAGFVILDMDPRNGGDESVRALRENGWPKTRQATTGGGGIHYWYTTATPLERPRRELAAGIDVKVPGKGYVILPPSEGYSWRDEREPVELPAWARERIEREAFDTTTAAAATTHQRYFAWDEGTRYGLAGRDREIGELMSAPEGTRNDSLNRAAFSIAQLVAGGELDEESARERLERAAERVGLEPEEIALTVESGWSAGAMEPRNAPERDESASATNRPLDPARRVTGDPGAQNEHFWTEWMVDEPPPPFWLDPVLPKNAYVLVYGATEASKSMVWNAILADGSRNGVKSSVYSLENPRHVDRDRLRRLHPDPCCFRITHEPLDLGSWTDVDALVERERDWGTNVVLIDTYSHAFGSFRSEDGNARAVEFARVIRHVMHELDDQGLSVVVIDHTGYQHREEPRDASAKRQQVDVAILMEKEGEWIAGAREARFSMSNFKASRFANPFMDERGAVVGLRDEDLHVSWATRDLFSAWGAA